LRAFFRPECNKDARQGATDSVGRPKRVPKGELVQGQCHYPGAEFQAELKR
jgi:hypothetical protein